MATRRNFFKYLGIAGGAAAGGAVAAASLVASSGKSKAVKEIEEADQFALRINQDYGKENLTFASNYREAFRLDSTGTLHLGTSAPKVKLKTVSVDMVPGPDGELYLKTNGKWRKIVTE
jgi:hypothetical protein